MNHFLTFTREEAEIEAEDRASWNPRATYEVKNYDPWTFGLWVTYSNCNYAHWAREI